MICSYQHVEVASMLMFLIGTGHVLPLPQVTYIQGHPEEGTEP